MYPMYQLSALVGPPVCFLRVLGHALVVILARVTGQLVSDGIASPVKSCRCPRLAASGVPGSISRVWSLYHQL